MTGYLQHKMLYAPMIGKRPALDLGMVVVIPAYCEERLLQSLMSLQKCEKPICGVEIIVLINNAQNAPTAVVELNRKIYLQALDWVSKQNASELRFWIEFQEFLPPKHAGVGLARKVGMDEAAFRLQKVKNPRGIIVCFDADCKVDKNYLVAIEQHFKKHTRTQAASIYYEHPLDGIHHDDAVYQAILEYELHLRYYTNAQRFTGFPFATETVGSSMAVRCDAYQQQGGMNRRKAGEDFYFIHKFTVLGKHSEINTTRVIPSPRISDRVPFGTGRAVGQMIQDEKELTTYNWQSFVDLKQLFRKVNSLFEQSKEELIAFQKSMPKPVADFLEKVDFLHHVQEIQNNTKDKKTFKNRFFRWFNAFQMMKYVHYVRDHHYANVSVTSAARDLFSTAFKRSEVLEAKELLLQLRKLDKER